MHPDRPIADQLAHLTIRIEVEFESGHKGTGTGFFYKFCITEKTNTPAIVTNKHVVANGRRARFRFSVEKNGKFSGEFRTMVIENLQDLCIKHPDDEVDLCLIMLGPLMNQARINGWEIFWMSIDDTLAPTDSDVAELFGLEQVIMVGYPIGLWDRVNNRPVFRRGITATAPSIDWNQKPEFLIDVACFPGSSGSPVFLYEPTGYLRGHDMHLEGRCKFLGVLYAGPVYTVEGNIEVVTLPTATQPVARSTIPINLGNVIKWTKVREFNTLIASIVSRGDSTVPSASFPSS